MGSQSRREGTIGFTRRHPARRKTTEKKQRNIEVQVEIHNKIEIQEQTQGGGHPPEPAPGRGPSREGRASSPGARARTRASRQQRWAGQTPKSGANRGGPEPRETIR
ncbi:hypothetical protein MTO96_036058 [Rhipicephalus appendiculatus]